MAYCPECGSEYREGYTRCNLCETALVPVLPDDFEEPNPEGLKFKSSHQFAEPLTESEVTGRMKYLAWIVLILIAFLWTASLLSSVSLNAWSMVKSPPGFWNGLLGWLFVFPQYLSIYLILACILAGTLDVANRRKILAGTTYIAAGYSIPFTLGLILYSALWVFRERSPGQMGSAFFASIICRFGSLALFGLVSAYFIFGVLRSVPSGRIEDDGG